MSTFSSKNETPDSGNRLAATESEARLRSNDQQPYVWIIVLTWNRVEEVVSCVLGLNALHYRNYHVLVVDNHSEDGTVERLRDLFPKLDIVVNGRNLGYTGGNNVGIRYALERGADYVLLLNNDTLVHPRLLNELVAVAESDPKIAVVGAKNLYYHDRQRIWSAWGSVTYGPTLSNMEGRNSRDCAKFSETRDVRLVAGCGYLWSRKALADIGLLDTDFFGYHEDVDWCHRASLKGWRVVYAGTAIVYHKGSSSADPTHKKSMPMMYFLGRNAMLFARKHASPDEFLRLIINTALGSIQRYERDRRKGNQTGEVEFWRGVWDGLRGINRKKDFRFDPLPTPEKGEMK